MKRSFLPVLAAGIAACAAVLLADVWTGGYMTGLQGLTTIPKGPLVLHNTQTCVFKAVAFFSDIGASDVTAAASWTLSSSSNLIVWDDQVHCVIKATNANSSIDRATLSAAYGGYTAMVRVASFNTTYAIDTDQDNIPDNWETNHGLSAADSGDALQCWFTNGLPQAALSNNLLLFVLDASVPARPVFPSNFWVHTSALWSDDTDSDNIPDRWEYLYYYGNLGRFSYSGDYDSDGLTDYEEYCLGLNPTDNDMDRDSLKDYWDINPVGTNPLPVVAVNYPAPGGEI